MANKYILFIFFLVLFNTSLYATDFPFKQGNDIPDLTELKIGLSKLDLAGILGKPNLIVSRETNVWCYCIYEFIDLDKFYIRYLILYFDDDDALSFIKMYESSRDY